MTKSWQTLWYSKAECNKEYFKKDQKSTNPIEIVGQAKRSGPFLIGKKWVVYFSYTEHRVDVSVSSQVSTK